MNPEEALTKSRELVREHLPDYSIVLDSSMNRLLGQCQRQFKRIRLNRRFVEAEDWVIIEDTVLHEIAHGLSNGLHGQSWKSKARELGVIAFAAKTPPNYRPHFLYSFTCPDCKRVWHRNRRPRKRNLFCPFDYATLKVSR